MLTPAWTDTIRRLYLSNAANQFVIHGNVEDRLLIGEAGEVGAVLGNLVDFLTRQQLQRFDLVLSYELGAGLRIESGEAFFKQLHLPMTCRRIRYRRSVTSTSSSASV